MRFETAVAFRLQQLDRPGRFELLRGLVGQTADALGLLGLATGVVSDAHYVVECLVSH
jgi:hypothetical protein